MTEFITRSCKAESRYEVIIKTDSEGHYKATEDFARQLIDHAKPQTNADQIRAMSDEELATVLYDCDSLGYCSSPPECGDLLETSEGIPKEKCIDCVLAWLRQPTKGE